ncbi:hypothetical protein ACFS7Z_08905 [Pontibacter toksunensis]|uniref:DUF3823 domain-containing protein n=1 Tax=Pontibacter toksunensis TaxID=1332631 RepID=A0ABW6BT45_9BACT
MKQLKFIKALLLIFLMLSTACSKDAPEPDEPYTGNGYIRGNFGSEYLTFKEPQITGDGDSSSHYYNPNINGGLLLLTRVGLYSDRRSVSLIINGIDLDNLPLPIVISPSQALENRMYGAVMLYDYTIPDSVVRWGPEDSYNFEGTTQKDITINITSKTDDIIKGTFEGKIRSRTGLEKAVTGGEFRIKIIRKE